MANPRRPLPPPRGGPQPSRGAPFSGLVMMAGGLGGIAGCLWYIAKALARGEVVGRWGAHPPGSLVFTLSVGGAGLGVLLGLACIALGWRWFRHGSDGGRRGD